MEPKLMSKPSYYFERSQLKDSVKKYAFFTLSVISLITVLGFVGWLLDIDILKRPVQRLVAINPITSVSLFLCAFSFGLVLFERRIIKRNNVLIYGTAGIAFVIAFLRLVELVFHLHIGVDSFLFDWNILDETEYYSSRMGLLTSSGILFLSVAVALSAASRSWCHSVANYFALAILVIAAFSITGYIYKVREFYLVAIYSPVSIQSAVAFLLFSILILLYNNKNAFMRTLSSVHMGGVVARIMTPFILIMPVSLGLICLALHRSRPYSTELGIALLVIAVCAFFFLFVWYLSRLLNNSDHIRTEAEQQLESLNAELEQKVEQRTNELLRSEFRFKSVVENSFDAILFINNDFELMYRSPSFERTTGWETEDELVRKHFFTVHPDDTQKMEHIRNRVLGSANLPIRSSIRVLHKDGRYLWLDIVFTNQLHNSTIGAIIVTFRDVTSKKMAEEKLIKSNRLYAFISQINQSIVQIKDQQVLFQRTCEIARDFGKFHSTWIALLNENGRLDCTHYFGIQEDNLWRYLDIDYKNAEQWLNLNEVVFEKGEFILFNSYEDIDKRSHWYNEAHRMGYKSSIVFPLRELGKISGFVCFNSAVEDFFDSNEIALLKEATGDISFALDILEKERQHIKTDEQLRLNENRLRKAQQIAHLGSWEFDIATGHTIWSEEVYRLIGIPINSLSNIGITSLLDYIHPDDLSLVKETMKLARQGSNTAVYYRVVRKDGRLRHVYSESRLEFDSYDNPVRIIGIIYDITESREAEIKLVKSEQRFRSLIENNYDAILLLDSRLDITYASPSVLRILGIMEGDKSKTDTTDLFQLVLEEDRHSIISKINIAKRKPKVPVAINFRIKHDNGFYIWLEGLVSNLIEDNNIKGYLINLHDVTNAKRSEAALRLLNDRLEQKVDERTKEVKRAFEDIREKNLQITDSIQYAKRIQKAILPSESDIAKSFPNHFVYFKPASIVSGDFYWYYKKDNIDYIAAVDCTGHGVPGAFMSIIGHELLNRAVSEYDLTEPSEIMRFVDKGLSTALHLKNEESDLNDGMDMILCAIDSDLQVISYCSALRPLFYETENALKEIQASRISLGSNKSGKEKTFDTQHIHYSDGDRIYLTSDGYYAQFGGEKGKKIGKKQFKQILQELSMVPISNQKQMLNLYFNQWKGAEEQVDDVMIIGIELN